MTDSGTGSAPSVIPGFERLDGAQLSVELAERMIAAMHEGLLIFDQDGRQLFANRRAIVITGIPLAEFPIVGPDSRFQPVGEDGEPCPWEQRPTAVALRTGRHCSRTLGVPRGDAITWIVFNAEPILREGDTGPYRVVTVLTDITEHKLAQLALAHSEELQSAIMGASLDAILTLTREGEIVDINDAAERLYLTSRDLAAGERMTDFIPLRDRQVWEQLLERLREDPGHLHGRRIEGTGRRSDGSEFPFEASINSLEAGQRQFFVTFVHDVTDRKASERRLADARDAALRASVGDDEPIGPMTDVIEHIDMMADGVGVGLEHGAPQVPHVMGKRQAMDQSTGARVLDRRLLAKEVRQDREALCARGTLLGETV